MRRATVGFPNSLIMRGVSPWSHQTARRSFINAVPCAYVAGLGLRPESTDDLMPVPLSCHLKTSNKTQFAPRSDGSLSPFQTSRPVQDTTTSKTTRVTTSVVHACLQDILAPRPRPPTRSRQFDIDLHLILLPANKTFRAELGVYGCVAVLRRKGFRKTRKSSLDLEVCPEACRVQTTHRVLESA